MDVNILRDCITREAWAVERVVNLDCRIRELEHGVQRLGKDNQLERIKHNYIRSQNALLQQQLADSVAVKEQLEKQLEDMTANRDLEHGRSATTSADTNKEGAM